MREVERIEDQLRRAYEGEAWHGPSVKEALEGVTAQKAAARPPGGSHSIWEIVSHIATGEEIVRQRLAGRMAGVTTEEDWWPPVKQESDKDWDALLERLESANRELRSAVLSLEDERLDEPIHEGMSSIYITLHGVVQHDLYHAGQIMILKKLVST